jgi:uncharacterized protein YdaU (DUF1376 family)
VSTKIWMPLYIADYLADTTRLTTEQHGAYMLLIMDYWRNGAPPDDDAVLSNITRLSLPVWKKSRIALLTMFEIEDGLWVHKRIDKEIKLAADNSDKYSKRAKLAAEKRWGKDASSNATSIATSNKEGLHIECTSPSPSPSISKDIEREPKKKSATLPNDFELTAASREFSDGKGLDTTAELEKFVNWHSAKGSTMKDWQAAWRTWCGKAAEFKAVSPAKQAAQPSFRERDAEAARLRAMEISPRIAAKAPSFDGTFIDSETTNVAFIASH